MCGKERWIFQFGPFYKKNQDLPLLHKRMLPDKAIMLNPLHNADFLTCNNFR